MPEFNDVLQSFKEFEFIKKYGENEYKIGAGRHPKDNLKCVMLGIKYLNSTDEHRLMVFTELFDAPDGIAGLPGKSERVAWLKSKKFDHYKRGREEYYRIDPRTIHAQDLAILLSWSRCLADHHRPAKRAD